MSGRQSKVCNVEFVCEFGLFISLLKWYASVTSALGKKAHNSAVNCHSRTECIYLLTSINFCDVKYEQPSSLEISKDN